MFLTCPKCHYQRLDSDDCSDDECPSCGLIFSKWQKYQQAQEQLDKKLAAQIKRSTAEAAKAPSVPSLLVAFFTRTRPLVWPEFYGYTTALIGFSIWGFYFINLNYESAEIGQSFMHGINLVFHEAGHVLFSFFGRFWTILGGSLFQVLVPLLLMFAFLWSRRDAFAASICLWWVGQSLMDLAPYIADARVMRLPLLGGGTGFDMPGAHDWNNLLRMTGRMGQEIQLAERADFYGSCLIVLSLIWGAVMLRIYFKQLSNPEQSDPEQQGYSALMDSVLNQHQSDIHSSKNTDD